MSRASKPVERVIPIIAAEEIPADWRLLRIADITEPVSKVNPKDEPNRGIQYIDISGIDNEMYRVAGTKTYIGRDAPSRARQLVRSGDIVFSTVRTYLKNFAQVPPDLDGQIASTGFCVLRTSDAAYQKFLFYFVQFDRFLNELAKHQRGTSYPAVRDGDVKAQYIPIPPPDQAARIVAEIEKQFSRLDEAVASLKRVKANLKRYKAAVLNAAVEGKLTEEWRKQNPDVELASKLLERILAERRTKWEEAELAKMKAKGKEPKNDNWKEKYKEAVAESDCLVDIPGSWVSASVDQLANVVQYGSSSKTSEHLEGVPVLRMGNIFEGQLDLKKLKYLPFDHAEFPEMLLQKGDLLFNRTNSPELVGKTAVYRGSPNPCSFASYLIRAKFNAGVGPIFVSSYLESLYGRTWVKSVVNQQVGQANVNGTKLKALVVPLPPELEQIEIVTQVELLLGNANRLFGEIEVATNRTTRLRQSVLSEAFLGALTLGHADAC